MFLTQTKHLTFYVSVFVHLQIFLLIQSAHAHFPPETYSARHNSSFVFRSGNQVCRSFAVKGFPCTFHCSASYIFRAHLKELHIKQSFSTPGTPYDNSVCESFFHTLKKEALYHHLYGTPQELQAVLDEYINFYNSQRPHRKLNMKTPNQYESAFYSGCL